MTIKNVPRILSETFIGIGFISFCNLTTSEPMLKIYNKFLTFLNIKLQRCKTIFFKTIEENRI